jgi:hypothetical protein
MAQVELELARNRQRDLRDSVALQRDGRRALAHGRLVRQARRAERALLDRADEAGRLRARIAEMEAGF